jgi:hypothetical protein
MNMGISKPKKQVTIKPEKEKEKVQEKKELVLFYLLFKQYVIILSYFLENFCTTKTKSYG